MQIDFNNFSIKKHFINLIWIIPLSLYIVFSLYSTANIYIDMSGKNILSKSKVALYYKNGKKYSDKQLIMLLLSSDDKGNILAKYRLNNFKKIKGIRFDPPEYLGKRLKINSIQIINGFSTQNIDLYNLSKSKTLKLHNMKIEYKNNSMIFIIDGNDPHIQLFNNFNEIISSKYIEIILYSLLFTILGLILSIFILKSLYIKKGVNYIVETFHINRIYKFYITSLVFMIFSILIIKTFTTFISLFYYNRELNIYDILLTYSTDILIVIVIFITGLFLLLLSSFIKSNSFYKVLVRSVALFSKILQFIIHLILILMSILLFGLGLYYLLSGYIFLEWGAFIEPQHIEAVRMHGGTEEFIEILFTIKTYIFILLIFLFLFLSHKFSHYIHNNKKDKGFIIIIVGLILFGVLAYFPINHIYKSKPSTESPILMITKDLDNDTDSVDKSLLKDINIDNFNPIESENVPTVYKKFKAIAKNMNVIFFVMESTRKKSLPLYGYKRDTMPFLSSLAKNSLVFHNAVVTQPRTMKTMVSLTLGIYPDPRAQSLITKYSQIGNQTDNLLKTLIKNNYSLYYSTMYSNYGGSNYKNFLNKITQHQITLREDIEMKKQNLKNRKELDERLLTDSFLVWSAQQKQKFTSILWTKLAHMPYISSIKKYEENSKTDMYDNCLVNIDNSLKNLVEGLKKQGKLDNTLIIILGDHGEAVEDKMDWGHGNFLYEHSIKIPFLIYNSNIFPNRIDIDNRFQIKDIASSVFYLLGIDKTLNQSINIFSKSKIDKIYLSNIYQDYKLGFIFDNYKFVYRPKYDISYLFNMNDDPNENINIIGQKTAQEIKQLKEETLEWYKYQINYLNNNILKKR